MPLRRPQTLFIGNRVVKLNEVDSTNSFALSLLRSHDLAEGAVICTQSQTNGRGQRGNSWFSESGKNITCSIILKPTFLEITLQFDLTRAIALGIADLLVELLPSSTIRIKWPNDIIVDVDLQEQGKSDGMQGKKIAGILIENVINGSQVSASVVGIGLNVNQSDFGTDAPQAVSMMQLLGSESELEDIREHLFGKIEARYLQLRTGKIEKIRADFEEQLFMRGVMARYTDFKNIFDAKLEHVTPEGILVLRDGEGLERRFGFKEVGMLY